MAFPIGIDAGRKILKMSLKLPDMMAFLIMFNVIIYKTKQEPIGRLANKYFEVL